MNLPKTIGQLLGENRLTLGVAESCTGGLVGNLITDVPGSSDYFVGGLVAYHNRIKRELLHVSNRTLEEHGAVSAQTAEEMACGVLKLFKVDLGLSTTGIAGPGGGTSEKPVGLVYISVATSQGESKTLRRQWARGRQGNKMKTTESALLLLRNWLEQSQ
ncbi:MAG: CinA family protein [Candidatus Bipolaricaulota bacterium]